MTFSGDALEREAMALLERMLEQPLDERLIWLRDRADADPCVVRRAEQLLGALERAGGRLATGAASDDVALIAPPRRIGAYRIIELVGQGGMGAVFRARRDAGDFEHEVAIKLVRPGVLSDGLIERFEHERQILAKLIHPNIARLYDGGTTEEGAPFIVMEFIEGIPITDWAEEKALPLHERLGLFRLVCGAVSYAHQNLIIHRDLTPANVLVTEAGEPKVIDFGIARPQQEHPDADDEGGAAPGLSLTPGFAAPERFTGAPATTLTDVFSLGKILEELTGRAEDPDLRSIVAKATASATTERYPTANALSQDVARLLDGRPVEARPATRTYLIRRFVARNRGAVLGGLASFALLVIALAATTYAYGRAEVERTRAAARFAETRAIARSMMFDVYDEVSRVPGSVRARLLLANTAQRYLESLAADESADADIRFDAALGYFRLAQVVGARTGGGTVGQTARAKRLYGRARELLQQMHSDQPDRRDIQAALGQVIAVLADSALFSDGNFEAAKRDAAEARRLLSDLPNLDEASAGALGMTFLHEGNALAWEAQPERAGEVYHAGLARLDALPPHLRDLSEPIRARAELLRMLGAYHAYFRRPTESRRSIAQSLAIHRTIAQRSGNAPRDIYGLVTVLHALAQAQFGAGNVEQARPLAAEAAALARRGIDGSPNDAGPRELFTSVAIFQAHLLAAGGSDRQAVALADEAIAIKRALASRTRDVVSGPMTLAVRLQEASEVYLLAGRRDRACPVMRESVAIMRDYERTAALPIANRRDNLEPMLAALRDCGIAS